MGHWAGQSLSTVAGQTHLADQSLSKACGFGPACTAPVQGSTTPIEEMRIHECQKQASYTPNVFSSTLRRRQRIARGVSKSASHLQQLTWLDNCFFFVNAYSSFNDTWKCSPSQHAVREMIWFRLLLQWVTQTLIRDLCCFVKAFTFPAVFVELLWGRTQIRFHSST